MQNTGLVFKLTTDTTNYSRGLKKANSELGTFQGAMGKLGGIIAGAFTVGGIMSFSKQVINVTAEFQKYRAVLTNTLGSQGIAEAKLDELTQFASKTPFAINELTSAFVKLANQGFVPTSKEMTKLGDIASSTGKTFDQLAEALLDAQTGEFERLKEFGIKAKKSGDVVSFSFKGVSTQVKNTNEDIRDYILSLGEMEGVSGSMAAISDTLGGKISNLGDAWSQFMLAIGDSKGPLKGAIGETTSMLSAFTNVLNDIDMSTLDKLSAFMNINSYRFSEQAKSKTSNALAQTLANDVDSWQGPRFNIKLYEEQKKVTAEATKSLGIYGELNEKLKAYKEQLESANSEKTIRVMREKISLLEMEKQYYDSIGTSLKKMNALAANPITTGISSPGMQTRNSAGPVNLGKMDDAPSLVELQETSDMASAMLSNFREDILNTAAEGFGLMLAGDMGLGEFFNGIIMLVADFAKQFGKMLVGIGLAKISLDGITKPGGGIGAVIAGFAIQATATAIGALLSKGPDLQGLATGTNYVPNDGPYYLHQGEAVVPKKYNNGNGAGMPSMIRVVGNISGRDIRLTQAREDYYHMRTAGR